MLSKILRLAFAAAAALTMGFIWTVGQGGFRQTNQNLCELWASLPLPSYESCEFQYGLIYAWLIVASIAVAWFFYEISRYVRSIQRRNVRLTTLWVGLAFFAIGTGLCVYMIVLEHRRPSSVSVKKPNALPPESEKVRDQLKLAAMPILMRDPVDVQGKKYIEAVRIGLPLRNDAPIGVSYTINNVTTIIEGQKSVPETPYPSKGPTLLQGEGTTFQADYMKLTGVACGTVRGEVHFDISYGLPGHEVYSFKRKLQFKIVFDPASCNMVQQTWNWIPDT